MKHLWVLAFITVILSPAISHAEEQPAANAPSPPEQAQPAPAQAPVEAAPVHQEAPISSPPVQEHHDAPAESKAEPAKEAKPANDNHADRPHSEKHDDWKKGDKNPGRPVTDTGNHNGTWPKNNNGNNHGNDYKGDHGKNDGHHRPHIVFRRPPVVVYHWTAPRIVYVYPESYYPSIDDYANTSYPSDYVSNYKIGDFLPDDREWALLPDYADYGLPAPRTGEQWVYSDRDVVLIKAATGQIVSAIVLAASID